MSRSVIEKVHERRNDYPALVLPACAIFAHLVMAQLTFTTSASAKLRA